MDETDEVQGREALESKGVGGGEGREYNHLFLKHFLVS